MKKLILLIGLFGLLISSYGQLQVPAVASSVQTDPYGNELITNGSFAADTDWDKFNGTTIAGGEAVINSAATYTDMLGQTSIGIENLKTYKVDLDITNYSSGEIRILLGNLVNAVTSTGMAANGSYSFELYLNDVSAPPNVLIYSWDAGAVMNVDNVSVKEVL